VSLLDPSAVPNTVPVSAAAVAVARRAE
jgi:hypothetical protein